MPRTDRHQIVRRIEESGIIAVIRADGPSQALDICKALIEGGVAACEVAMTTPGALKAIEMAAESFGKECLVGVGTVLDEQTARAAILAGARFIFTPIVEPSINTLAHRYDVPVVMGALTPTEIVTAFSSGAEMVKIFPANVFGPGYIRDIHGPLPQIKLAPTGGVNLQTAADWIKAGAAALGVGSSLVDKKLIQNCDWAGLTSLARQYVQIVRETRQAMK